MTEPIESNRLVVMAFMDSGNIIQFECDELELYRFPETYVATGGEEKPHPRAWEISGYNWTADGPVKYRLADLNVDKLEGIVTVQQGENGRETHGVYSRSRNQNRAADSEEAGG